MDMNRVCKICNEDKPIESFYKVSASSPYYRGECKECKNKGQRIRNLFPPAKLSKKEASRKARKLNHRRLLDYIGQYKCSMCGYTDEEGCTAPFDFHHLDGSTKEKGVGNLMQLSWERIKAEVDKCIILCAICHRKLHKCKESKMYEED
jgi:hypothetical protein